ncbi:MAG: alanine racemase [Gemmatimonadetes bacterium]|nr:alanine racemase [Gemmatimonadota bacterium]
MTKENIDTPALLVDAPALERNLEAMQRLADGFGLALRPHAKTHKSPALARLQIEAGARGITVAKVGEAEVMAEAGLEDILIANQVIGETKLDRLVRLAERARTAILVDGVEGVQALEQALARRGLEMEVMIEVDTGKRRCGLERLEDILDVVRAIEKARHVRLRGLETHEGHVADGARSAEDLRTRAQAAGQRLVEVAEALRDRGIEIRELSVGSTPAAPYTGAVPGLTEMRPGTYVFNDVNQMAIGQATPSDCALSVLATVMSRPAPGRAVLDAGSKSLFAERVRPGFAGEYSGFGFIREAPGAVISSLSEEHAVVDLNGEALRVGDRVKIIPNHVCPCVNLHEETYVVRGGEVVDVWPIAARGKVR